MIGQFLQGFIFYLTFSLFALIGLTVTYKFGKKRPIFIYAISKPIGLIMFGYPVWLITSLNLNFINFNNQVLLLFLFFLALISSGTLLFYRVKNWYSQAATGKSKRYKLENRQKSFKSVIKKFVLFESISLIIFFIYLYFKGFAPQIEGTERFMDMLLYTSSAKTDHFPFFDGWQNLKDVNYYYYGFYLFALVNRLVIEFVPYSFGYNFSLGILFTSCLIYSFITVYEITKKIWPGLLGSFLVTLAGNIHYTACVRNKFMDYSNYTQNFSQRSSGDPLSLSGYISQECYYPSATRILDPSYTINEFPSYSFILGDMHPHVISIPFFLINLYLILLFYKSKKINHFLLASIAFGLATSIMINSWDFMTLGLIFALVVMHKFIPHTIKQFKEWKKEQKAKTKKVKNLKTKKVISNKSFQQKIKNLHATLSSNRFYRSGVLIAWSLIALVSPFILYLPFFLHFQGPVEGVGFAPNYVKKLNEELPGYQYPSSLDFLLGIWGFYFIISFIFLGYLAYIRYKEGNVKFIIFLFLVSTLLIILTESIFFKDLFHIVNPSYFRANTVFKFGYHAWMIFGITTASVVGLSWMSISKVVKNLPLKIVLKSILGIVISIYIFSTSLFTYYGFKQGFGPTLPFNFETKSQPCMEEDEVTDKKVFTLDGNYYMCTRSKDDLEAINWINDNIDERVTILEAVGSSYTFYGRLSVNTGMGNPLNWESHQWTWRFGYPEDVSSWKDIIEVDEETGKRKLKSIDTGMGDISKVSGEVKTMYTSEDIEQTWELLKKYKVKYVYIGDLEKEKYDNIKQDKFEQISINKHEFGDSALYEIEL